MTADVETDYRKPPDRLTLAQIRTDLERERKHLEVVRRRVSRLERLEAAYSELFDGEP